MLTNKKVAIIGVGKIGETLLNGIIKTKEDIDRGLSYAQKIKGVKGAVIIKDDKMGLWGDINFTVVKQKKDDKQILYAFFSFKVKFCGLIEYNKSWDVGGLDGVTIRL